MEGKGNLQRLEQELQANYEFLFPTRLCRPANLHQRWNLNGRLGQAELAMDKLRLFEGMVGPQAQATGADIENLPLNYSLSLGGEPNTAESPALELREERVSGIAAPLRRAAGRHDARKIPEDTPDVNSPNELAADQRTQACLQKRKSHSKARPG